MEVLIVSEPQAVDGRQRGAWDHSTQAALSVSPPLDPRWCPARCQWATHVMILTQGICVACACCLLVYCLQSPKACRARSLQLCAASSLRSMRRRAWRPRYRRRGGHRRRRAAWFPAPAGYAPQILDFLPELLVLAVALPQPGVKLVNGGLLLPIVASKGCPELSLLLQLCIELCTLRHRVCTLGGTHVAHNSATHGASSTLSLKQHAVEPVRLRLCVHAPQQSSSHS